MNSQFGNSYSPATVAKALVVWWVLVISAVAMAIVGMMPTAAYAQAGNVYSGAQVLGTAEPAQVLQVRMVASTANQHWSDQAAGVAIGGALGAALGNRASDNNRALTTTLGTLIGGAVGNRVAQRVTRDDAQEILLRTENGRILAVVQPAPFDALSPGEQVYLLAQNGQYRIIRAMGWVQQRPQISPMPPVALQPAYGMQ